MPTATLAGQTEIIESPTLGRELGVVREIHELRIGSAAIGAAILLDETIELLPLAGDRQIARITTNGNREIHDAPVLI
jgi:hypothetical protein